MRIHGIEDFALPLTLVFAVVFCLTLRHEIALPLPTQAVAAVEMRQPDYVMTITAKRLPAQCRVAAAQTRSPYCGRILAGDARIEMREGTTRLAARTQGNLDAY